MTIPFSPIAKILTRSLHPAPSVDISAAEEFLSHMEQNKHKRGVLLTANHFSAIDFHSWWFVIILSATIPVHVHWVVSAGWTNSGWLTGFTHWLFPRGAKILGFTSMPAMPPDPSEVEQRARAVRQVLDYASQSAYPVIGLTPEGGDFPGGVLGNLPPGVGRFIHLLSRYCPDILPVGVWKEHDTILLKFGSLYSLDVPEGISTSHKDILVGDTVMHHIAELLPERLRGKYG